MTELELNAFIYLDHFSGKVSMKDAKAAFVIRESGFIFDEFIKNGWAEIKDGKISFTEAGKEAYPVTWHNEEEI